MKTRWAKQTEVWLFNMTLITDWKSSGFLITPAPLFTVLNYAWAYTKTITEKLIYSWTVDCKWFSYQWTVCIRCDSEHGSTGWPSLESCYINCCWGKVGAVTLLAPGRRWSLTYGSASPLESIAFRPCGHRHTKTHAHVRSKVTSLCP